MRLWKEDRVRDVASRSIFAHLDAKGVLDWEQCFTDDDFVPARKGGFAPEEPREAK